MARALFSVTILHCGGDEELKFIQKLSAAIDGHEKPPFRVECTEYRKQQNKELVMYHDAVNYNKRKLPLLVLLSVKFFELVWLTIHKQEILNVITSYSTDTCLHIWLDVNDGYVAKCSTRLLRMDRYFRRTTLENLSPPVIKPSEMVDKIYSLLTEKDYSWLSPLNNYAVDDEIEQMRINFFKQNPGVVQDKAVPTKENENGKKGKGKADQSKDIFRLQNMSKEELDVYIKERDAQMEHHNTVSTSKKKKKKKKSAASTMKYLLELPEKEIERISTYLDQGPGANWWQIAECYRISEDSIKEIDNNPKLSHTEQLISLLRKQYPKLELTDFIQKCKDIMRFDVATYINDLIN